MTLTSQDSWRCMGSSQKMKLSKSTNRTLQVALVAIATMHLGVSASRGGIHFRPVVLVGDEAVGVGGIYQGFAKYVIGKNGQIGFSAHTFSPSGDRATGIWAERNGKIDLVVGDHEIPPGMPAGSEFTYLARGGEVFIDGLGRVSFVESTGLDLGDGNSDNRLGIWSETPGGLTLVASTGSQAPGTPAGTNFFGLSYPRMGAGGAIAFHGGLVAGQGGVDSSNSYGIWAEQTDSLNLLARSGSAAPGLPAGIKFGVFADEPAVNGPGQVAFVAYLVEGSGGVTSENSGAIFSNTSSALSLLVREGAQAPGAPSGAKFDYFQGLNLSDSGKLVFIGFLKTGSGGVNTSNDRGIWLNESGAMTLVAREGQQAPGLSTGAKFGNVFLGDPLVNGAGKVLFRSNLTTGSGGVTAANDYSIWSNAYGSLSLVAREGDPAPGATDGAVFQDFDAYAFNSLGQIAIRASVSGGVSGNETGVWMTDPQGKLTLVARTGVTLEVAPGDIGTITGAGFRGVFSADRREYQALNDSGELLLSLGYVSNSQLRSGLFVASFYDTNVHAIEILESEFVPTAEGGEFQLLVQVQPAAHYRVEDSGDLKVWSDYLEFTATEEQKVLVVPTRTKVPDNSSYFFRIRRE